MTQEERRDKIGKKRTEKAEKGDPKKVKQYNKGK